MADNPLYDKLLLLMQDAVRKHGGPADLLPENEFDCCMSEALDVIWPEIEKIQELADDAFRKFGTLSDLEYGQLLTHHLFEIRQMFRASVAGDPMGAAEHPE